METGSFKEKDSLLLSGFSQLLKKLIDLIIESLGIFVLGLDELDGLLGNSYQILSHFLKICHSQKQNDQSISKQLKGQMELYYQPISNQIYQSNIEIHFQIINQDNNLYKHAYSSYYLSSLFDFILHHICQNLSDKLATLVKQVFSIQFTIKMLRKNNLERVRQGGDKINAGCQTQEFMLYLAMEQKLDQVYQQYRELQVKYGQANRLIDFLKYKNQYLQTSLCEISVAFNHSISKNNSHYIEEIRNLDQIISRESQELENINLNNHQTYSFIHEENTKGPSNKLANSRSLGYASKSQRIQDPPSIIKYRMISPIEESNISEEDKPETSLSQSQNEFLPEPPQSLVLAQRRQNSNCTSQRYKKNQKVSHNQKYATSRQHGQSKHKKSSVCKKKAQKVGKQNINYEKLIRIEAELKMKQFMEKFHMDSRLRQPSQSNMYCEEVEFINGMQEPEGCISTR